jgi:ribose 5-phosphate isomerase RpiB
MKNFTIAIGSDHAGFAYKEKIKAALLAGGHTVRDFGTQSETPCDYPDFIRPVAESVARGEFERGIVLGGSGNGEAIVANRVRGVRCGLCWNEEIAKQRALPRPARHPRGPCPAHRAGLARDPLRGRPPPAAHPEDRRRLN